MNILLIWWRNADIVLIIKAAPVLRCEGWGTGCEAKEFFLPFIKISPISADVAILDRLSLYAVKPEIPRVIRVHKRDR